MRKSLNPGHGLFEPSWHSRWRKASISSVNETYFKFRLMNFLGNIKIP